MARSRSNYIEAAIEILTELGGGPLSSKDLVKIVQERGLVSTGPKYVYHNFLRKIRESDEFDTSVRGQVSLRKEAPVEEVAQPIEAAIAEGTPAAVISEILSSDYPASDALDNVEDEEINPDGTGVKREF